ncbi:pre-mRNA-processing protein 45 [Polyplosphaeria fusca]|uniref:Pre-mRNA-processing protein 45 n=1 Tax=Polyplosphaeria fusca TaxID=682080 RepID=A0A9P4R427_9PLEO|nr:pre-mRNA-processing protein 45 [Polyplosphaeria fusca]
MSVTSLAKSLPKPKYSGEDEVLERATRVFGQQQNNQIATRQNGPPPYGARTGWRPRDASDFGDGGAFPEIPIAQYPLEMGRKDAPRGSNAIALRQNSEGQNKYDDIARRGHAEDRIVQSSFRDLIPLRQRADAGEINLERPSQEMIQATKERTEAALQALVTNQTSAQRPKAVKGRNRDEPTYVRYTPTAQMGDGPAKPRIIQINQRQLDPFEPPKHKFKRIPGRAPSPPPPVLHSPPRKLTAADQEAWRIPPSISNWKNPKGYTVPLDKRLAADGRGMQDVTINDKFAAFSEALNTADRHAREEVQQRALFQQKLAEKEKLQREEHLRALAQQAREDRQNKNRRSSHSSSGSDAEDRDAVRQRDEMRRERRQEYQREMRQSRMGTERKIQMMAREQNRDISEKVALGLAKPTQSGESMYDSRLFNKSSGFDSGFNEDNHYDKPLFAAQEAISSIYRPNIQQDDEEDAGETYNRIAKSSRFEGLGAKGADPPEQRDGPVQFEKDKDDPFNIDAMINEVKSGKQGQGEKRYGIQQPEDEGRATKRARVDDDSD